MSGQAIHTEAKATIMKTRNIPDPCIGPELLAAPGAGGLS
jgi:hypothetical protein